MTTLQKKQVDFIKKISPGYIGDEKVVKEATDEELLAMISLSELYTAAITAYVTEHQKEDVTETLNRVLENESSSVEPEMVKMLVLSIGNEEW